MNGAPSDVEEFQVTEWDKDITYQRSQTV